MSIEDDLNVLLDKLCNPNNSSAAITGLQTQFICIIKQHGVKAYENIPTDTLCAKLSSQLTSPLKSVRGNCFRCFLLILPHLRSRHIERHCIDLFLVRAIDEGGNQSGDETKEGVEALRFVNCLSKIDALPRSIVCCLVSLIKSVTNEVFIKCATGILCTYILKDPELVIECDGIKSILHRIMMGGTFQETEILTQILIYLFDKANTRTYIHLHYDIGFLLAPLSDSFFVLYEKKGDFKLSEIDYESDREVWRAACKNTILSLSRTWAGLYTLKPIFEEFMCALKRPFPKIQSSVLHALYEMFLIPQPSNLNSFEAALSSAIDRKDNPDWGITEDWVANEAFSVLPPHHIHKPDLVKIYQTTLLAIMLKVDPKLDSVTHVAINGEESVAIAAAFLVAELLHLIDRFNLLPEQHIAHIQPLLVEAVSANEGFGKVSSYCISKILNHRRSKFPNISFHLKLIKDHVQLFKDYTVGAPITTEDRQQNNFIEETRVFATDNFINWNWKKISSLIDLGFFRFQPEDSQITAFLKRVVEKFTSQFMLVMIPLYDKETGEENSAKYTNVGIALVNVLLEINVNRIDDLKDLIPHFLKDMCRELHQVKVGSGMFSPQNMKTTLVRDYFFIIGALVRDMQGKQYIKSSLIFETYLHIIEKCPNSSNKDVILKCIIASLTYGLQEDVDAMFNKIIHHGSNSVRLFAVKYMRCLMRCGYQNFEKFILPTLINQVYGYNGDSDEIVDEALDILTEACQDEACKEHLLDLFPAIIHLGNKGYNLFIQFLSLPNGYEKLLEIGFVDSEITRWKERGCMEYVRRVEETMLEAFTSYEPGECIGRIPESSLTAMNKTRCYAPPHLFGELAHCDFGIEKLETEQIFEFLQGYLDSGEDVKIKAAAWAIGHIAASSYGYAKLSKRDMIVKIHALSYAHPCLSVRGTCFYALNLVCKTESGCATVDSLGFIASYEDVTYHHNICNDRSKASFAAFGKIQDTANRQRSATLLSPRVKSHVKNRSIGSISINQIDKILQSVSNPQTFDSQDIQQGSKIGLCIPGDITSFFSINFDFRRLTVPEMDRNRKKEIVDPKVEEVLNLVINLSSTLKSGLYIEQLKELAKSHEYIFADFTIYIQIHELLSQYQFRQKTRRFIHTLFEPSVKHAKPSN